MDIAGENADFGIHLLGYDCTGRWNQLFKLTENCTIMTLQPSVIGRVRGGDRDIVSCLDSRHSSGDLLTAACEHLRPATNATAAAVVDATGAVAACSAGVEVRRFTTHQQYQFMPATGTAFKEFMK